MVEFNLRGHSNLGDFLQECDDNNYEISNDEWSYIQQYLFKKIATNENLESYEFELLISEGLMGSYIDRYTDEYDIYKCWASVNEIYKNPYNNKYYKFSWIDCYDIDWGAAEYCEVKQTIVEKTVWEELS